MNGHTPPRSSTDTTRREKGCWGSLVMHLPAAPLTAAMGQRLQLQDKESKMFTEKPGCLYPKRPVAGSACAPLHLVSKLVFSGLITHQLANSSDCQMVCSPVRWSCNGQRLQQKCWGPAPPPLWNHTGRLGQSPLTAARCCLLALGSCASARCLCCYWALPAAAAFGEVAAGAPHPAQLNRESRLCGHGEA